MGFPIKQRLPTSIHAAAGDSGADSPPPIKTESSGLDILSAVVASQRSDLPPPPPAALGLSYDATSACISDSSSTGPSPYPPYQSSTDVIGSNPTVKPTAMKAKANTTSPKYNTTHKRAKTFPEILLDIMSNPEYSHIVSWLPHGQSFAIHNADEFVSIILPKYFRKVIFRSFIRKLNRWGFRSVKRSVSGYESTFEHKLFVRDQPGLIARMFCKSNPSDKMPSVAAKKREEIMNSTTSNMTAVKAEDVVHLQNATAARDMSLSHRVASISAATSARAAAVAAASEGFVPPQVRHREEDILHQSLMEEAYRNSRSYISQQYQELLLQEMRQRTMMDLVQRMNRRPDDDLVQRLALTLRQQQEDRRYAEPLDSRFYMGEAAGRGGASRHPGYR